MTIPTTIFLFDIDGVLVQPVGYRVAVRSTLRYFLGQMGLDGNGLLPGEDVMSTFEAHRITSEWDMAPISLAVILDAMQAAAPGLQLPPNLTELAPLPAIPLPAQVPYRDSIHRIGAAMNPGEYPAEAALRLASQSPPALFPRLSKQPLLAQVLGDTRDVARSATTRIFQHFSLGSQAYTQTYGEPAHFETPSLLKENDQPLLPPALRDHLLTRQARGDLALAAYTMRPSLPPPEALTSRLGYAPEAEIALEMVGLGEIPLIGYGRVSYLAELSAASPEAYLKPSPVQALAAILAALTRQELSALQSALEICRQPSSGALPPELAELTAPNRPSLRIHVFEDTPGGIEAARLAGKLLFKSGVSARVLAWGVASHPEKIAALRHIGAPVLGLTQEAVFAALGPEPSRYSA